MKFILQSKYYRKIRKIFLKLLKDTTIPDIKINALKLLDGSLYNGDKIYVKTIGGGNPPKLVQLLQKLAEGQLIQDEEEKSNWLFNEENCFYFQ